MIFCKILEMFIKYKVNGSFIYENTTGCRLLKLYNIMLCYQNSKQLCVTVDKIQTMKKNTRKISLESISSLKNNIKILQNRRSEMFSFRGIPLRHLANRGTSYLQQVMSLSTTAEYLPQNVMELHWAKTTSSTPQAVANLQPVPAEQFPENYRYL